MTFLLWSLVAAVSFGLGFVGRRAWMRWSVPTSSPAIQSELSWLERHQRIKENAGIMVRKQRVEASRKSLQMKTLKLHLSPHFMFNALSSVQWKLQDGQVRQAQMLFRSFVDLWQQHWNETEVSMHALDEEVKSLNQYVLLECSRIDKTIEWHVDIQHETHWSHQVPALLFQPAIENAIWHGFSTPIENPKIHLVIRELPARPGWIQASVLDNGIGLSSDFNANPNQHQSVGMNVTQKRLTSLHSQASVEVIPAKSPWSTESRFTIPPLMQDS